MNPIITTPAGDAQSALLLALDERVLLKNVLLTVLLLIGVLGARFLVMRALRARGLAPDELRRYMASTRSLALATFLAPGVDTFMVLSLRLGGVSTRMVGRTT